MWCLNQKLHHTPKLPPQKFYFGDARQGMRTDCSGPLSAPALALGQRSTPDSCTGSEGQQLCDPARGCWLIWSRVWKKVIPRSIVKDNRDFNGKQLGKANISVIEQDTLTIQRRGRISKMNIVMGICRTPLNI